MGGGEGEFAKGPDALFLLRTWNPHPAAPVEELFCTDVCINYFV